MTKNKDLGIINSLQELLEIEHRDRLAHFVIESNKIEGINRPPVKAEVDELDRFIQLDKVTVDDMIQFVKVYQPNAELRDRAGLDVRVGGHYPPRGGKGIRTVLLDILSDAEPDNAWLSHYDYESLHPFTDCNGRSGRALWLWQMQSAPLGFLHTYYYQTLQGVREL
jgi:hypothetical protein